MVHSGLLESLVNDLAALDFEERKDAAQIFGAVVRMKETNPERLGGHYVGVEHPELLETLLQGYRDHHTAIACGTMLRDCLRSPGLSAVVASRPSFWQLFDHVLHPAFEVSSDAFSTLKEVLTREPQDVAPVLGEAGSDAKLLAAYVRLLSSDNYLVKRQSLSLLGTVFGLPEYARLALYLGNRLELLIPIMTLLRDSLRHISYEALLVFREIIVLLKTGSLYDEGVLKVLGKNRERLLGFIRDFQTDRDMEDEKLPEIRNFICGVIEAWTPHVDEEGSVSGVRTTIPQVAEPVDRTA